MTTRAIQLSRGEATDVLFMTEENVIFATPQHEILLRSPDSLAEDGAAILLDASCWWINSGSRNEELRIVRTGNLVEIYGKARLEQTHGDSSQFLTECSFENWTCVIQKLATQFEERHIPKKPLIIPLILGLAFGCFLADALWVHKDSGVLDWIETMPILYWVLYGPALLFFQLCVIIGVGLPGDAGWIMLPCYVIAQWALVGLTIGLIFVKRSNRNHRVSPPQSGKGTTTV